MLEKECSLRTAELSERRGDERRTLFPVLVMGCLYVLIYGLALLATAPYEAAGMTVFENPDDPNNVVSFLLTLVFFTVLILLIARFWKKQLIQAIVLGAMGLTAFYELYPLLAFVSDLWALFLSVLVAVLLILALLKHPEWYVIDACGVLVGTGTTAMLGISLSIPLSVAMLITLAVYDAVSVYRTKHMIDLADTMLDLRLPVMLVVPRTAKYSLITEVKSLKERIEGSEERDAFFLGLGDIIIPGILVASTFRNIAGNGLPIALAAMAGILFGFAVLMTQVLKGRPQAGLPYLCGGAIAGYLASSLTLLGQLSGFAG